MSSPRPFTCCPGCGEMMDLTRLGSVGVLKIRDSRNIKCGSCGKIFRTKGETWKEAHGGIR